MTHSNHLWFLTLIALVAACTGKQDIPVPPESLITRNAPPLMLQPDTTRVYLADYFRVPGLVDSVEAHSSIHVLFSPDSAWLILFPAGSEIPQLSVLTCWARGFPYALLVKRSPKVPVTLTFDPDGKSYREVGIAGQMNDWTPSRNPMAFNGKVWEIILWLVPGNYQYKISLDGWYISDPANPDTVSNGMGGYNSLLRAGNLLTADRPFLYLADATENTVLIGGVTPETDVIVFWENFEVPVSLLYRRDSSLIVKIPADASNLSRSFLRVWGAMNDRQGNDLLIPLKHKQVITRTEELSRSDKEAMILYFMMLDRFRNGNPANDQPVDDPEVDPRVNYLGGDLRGVIDKLQDGYFSSLGVNTIWLSPITQNPLLAYREYPAPHRKFTGYHGYWPITMTTVDFRFGTSVELKQLVNEAHARDMNVILDFVAHHVHEDYPLLQEHPEWKTQLDLPDGRKNIRLWDEQRLTTWFDVFLPTLDLSRPEVCELVADSAAYWVSEYDLDGFRHDAAKHVPLNFWRTLTSKLDSIVVPQQKSIYQIGETFGSRELIRSYINPGMLDAQFDFNLYWEAKLAFESSETSFEDLHVALLQSLTYFGSHNLMGNITGNQDLPRFITKASGALQPGEDDREAGWQRDIQVKDPIGYQRLASLMAFNMTIPGIPVIYYGDEFGLPGANDPDNRRMMKFSDLTPDEQHLLETTKTLTRLRSDHMALVYGDLIPLLVSDRQYVYARIYLQDLVIIAFNKSTETVTLKIPLPPTLRSRSLHPSFGGQCSVIKQLAEITLQPNSFDIFVP